VDITPDSLGPKVVNKIEVNSHFEKSSDFLVSAICPGVKGCTGMESADIVKALCVEYNFDLVIAVDALACNHISRMCNSIQVCTAGIAPGAGIGNRTIGINKKYIGVDVLAIGIPTVSDLNCYIETEEDYFVTPNNIDEAIDILSLALAISFNETLIQI
jgi:spore protease